jgi:DNA repair protein REV1
VNPDVIEISDGEEGKTFHSPPLHPISIQPHTFTSKEKATFNNRPRNALDDGFVESFYANSRLHFLSTWKLQMKIQVNQMLSDLACGGEKFSLKIPFILTNICSVIPQIDSKNQTILHIDMVKKKNFQLENNIFNKDSFFASVALKFSPHLKGFPIAVSHSNGPTADIASASYEARKRGKKKKNSVGK